MLLDHVCIFVTGNRDPCYNSDTLVHKNRCQLVDRIGGIMNIGPKILRISGPLLIVTIALSIANCTDDGGTGPGEGNGNGGGTNYEPPTITQSELTDTLNTGRSMHTATLLNDGRVLVTGGFDGRLRLKSCELYNPEKKAWKNVADMAENRALHTATLLKDGKVFVTGGSRLNGHSSVRFQRFDPVTETWSRFIDRDSLATIMDEGRMSHCATLLPDGRVLITGGYESIHDEYEKTYEIYNPVTHLCKMPDKPEPWMARRRADHTATLLENGRVLVAGGFNQDERYMPYCELYDPGTDTWSEADAMRTGRSMHRACRLVDGEVLVVGGAVAPSIYTVTCEVYDPVADQWSDIGIMKEVRYRHAAAQLSGTQVLVSGNRFSKTTELCTIIKGSGSWVYRDDMFEYRCNHTMTAFSNGVVLIVGGTDEAAHKQLSSCELFLP